jgi:hypothetical protein
VGIDWAITVNALVVYTFNGNPSLLISRGFQRWFLDGYKLLMLTQLRQQFCYFQRALQQMENICCLSKQELFWPKHQLNQ